jgi:uncharacterized RDD family membrane protein YckC
MTSGSGFGSEPLPPAYPPAGWHPTGNWYPPPGWFPPPKPPKGWQLGLPPAGPGSLAPPGRRLVGRLLDGLLFLPVSAALLTIALVIAAPHFGPLFPVSPPCAPSTAAEFCPTSNRVPGFLWLELTLLVAGLASGVIYVLADATITARRGRTPGKAIMHVRPIRVADRRPLSFWRALGRAGAVSFAGSLSWLGLIDDLWCLWDDNSQCIHDKVAETIVVSDT